MVNDTDYNRAHAEDWTFWRDRALAAEDYCEAKDDHIRELELAVKQLNTRVDEALRTVKRMREETEQHMRTAHPRTSGVY
jgi:type VI protein secretion system component VasK